MKILNVGLLIATAGAILAVIKTEELAQAAILGTENFSVSGGSSEIFTNLPIRFTIGPVVFDEPAPIGGGFAPLFEGIVLTPTDVGQTFTVNEATDPDFDNFVTFLTDGKPDSFALEYEPGSFIGVSGNGVFGGDLDLIGNTIDSISLQLNTLTISTPGSDPNDDGIWTDYSIDITISVDGQPLEEPPNKIPEPTSTLGLITFGVLGMGLILRKM
jgi:hypothetical protein